MSDVDRIPPASLDAEQAVIGSILVDREVLPVVESIVRAEDFYAHVHETIFAAIVELAKAEKPTDKLSLAEHLQDRKQLERVGGIAYLSGCMDVVPTSASAAYYAQIVAEKAQLRGLIRAGSQIVAAGFDGEPDVPEAIETAERALRTVTERGSTVSALSWTRDLVRTGFADLEDRFSHGSDAQLTPWERINRFTGGFYPGEMILWPGGAKMGKSAAVLDVADFTAAHYGPVVLFALEMGTLAIQRRYVALYADVSAKKQRLGEIRANDWDAIGTAMSRIAGRQMAVVDRRCNRLTDMRRECRRVQVECGKIAAIVIDGVNFIADADSGEKNSTKNNRMDSVYRRLLSMADEFGAVLHAVQHVNREGMRGKPSLRDIRDGGNPEGHAHAVIAPYRANPDATSVDERQQGEFLILAAREGDSGAVPMRFIGHRGLWVEQGAATSVPWFEAKGAA